MFRTFSDKVKVVFDRWQGCVCVWLDDGETGSGAGH